MNTDPAPAAANFPLAHGAASPWSTLPRSWWLWPHLLSLDAPLVALVWQRWWAHTSHAPLSLRQETILLIGVWGIYIADRLADINRKTPGGHDTLRHAFYAKHRARMQPLAWLAAVALIIITPLWLEEAEFRTGLGFATLTGIYFWLVHSHPNRRWSAFLPKEAIVGIIFAVGTGFFVLCTRGHAGSPGLWLGLSSFAMLCFLNCALITKWEHRWQDLEAPSSLLNAFPGLTGQLRTGCALLALVSLAAIVGSRSLSCLPVAASALMLAGLDWKRADFAPETQRVLADVVLLTPIFCVSF